MSRWIELFTQLRTRIFSLATVIKVSLCTPIAHLPKSQYDDQESSSLWHWLWRFNEMTEPLWPYTVGILPLQEKNQIIAERSLILAESMTWSLATISDRHRSDLKVLVGGRSIEIQNFSSDQGRQTFPRVVCSKTWSEDALVKVGHLPSLSSNNHWCGSSKAAWGALNVRDRTHLYSEK